MSWIVEIIWPLLIAFIVVVFRSSIENLSKRVVSFKYKDLDVQFGLSDNRKEGLLRLNPYVDSHEKIQNSAYLVGFLHDMGKSHPDFQRYIKQC